MIAALVLAAAFFAPPSPPPNPVLADVRSHIAAVVSDERAKTSCDSHSSRTIMYVAQAVDAFTTAEAVRGGAQGRTPFGSASNPLSYIASQGVFDLAVGALAHRASCKTKNVLNIGIGASAMMNAAQDGAK